MTDRSSSFLSATSAHSFVQQLQPDSELDSQTKAYQETLDHEVEASEKRRLNRIYYNVKPEEGTIYHGAEIARNTLQAKCEEFFALQKPSDPLSRSSPASRFRRHHRKSDSAHSWIGAEIKEAGLYTAEDVKGLTLRAEKKWKDGAGTIARNFNTICNSLDAHKGIFDCFPSATCYTSALCGAVSMIIQASVNYSTIAEQLSSHITTLSERILVCTRWVDAFHEPVMQERLASIYGAFFDFFTEVAGWFLKPWHARVLDSFNSHCAPKYEATFSAINRSLDLMTEYGVILIADGVLKLSQSAAYLREAMAKWRTEFKEVETYRREVGQCMHILLETSETQQMHLRQIEQQSRRHQLPTGRNQLHLLQQLQEPHLSRSNLDRRDDQAESQEGRGRGGEGSPTSSTTPLIPKFTSHADAKQYCAHFEDFITAVGASDGLDLVSDAHVIRLDPLLVRRLGAWLQPHADHGVMMDSSVGSPRTLWINSPYQRGTTHGAQLAAIKVLQVAIRAQAPFISHFCHRPHWTPVPNFVGTARDAGLLALVYSLILQLLQYRPPGQILLPTHDLASLGSRDRPMQIETCWRPALEILRLLLAGSSSVLGYCIISGWTELEEEQSAADGASELCTEFLDVLFNHAAPSLRVLLTTSGQSRILDEYVGLEGRVRTEQTAQQMARNGRIGLLF
ncbi:hypothetical protein ASPACDRAFT_44332 [Aspergillus aculeatus ATCC 16872]|uniref:DUF7708 domain-containing protein n=1 Tax=Aspergillus aculeatus (strain ATCC 16872 / CBS 172.66 / WB 5094) TaxID=690307 RepID=A0A1L9WRD3_ASPA1|nr:uncharacterized protein ASPACDRAFT_44332 [Aspergillus aculeatus ATCC 16872]OJJ98704.1 hypothetical protein ASPACDRAFT_44332 [Aspergillus aculeatus ATCC 16872]